MLTLVLTGIQSSKKAKKCENLPHDKNYEFFKKKFQIFNFFPEMIKYFKLTEKIEKKIGPYPT